MPLSKMHFRKFTAFDDLELDISPGLNVFVGANGTGKTHIMKAAYAACEASKTNVNYPEKIIKLFLPDGDQIGRLAKRHKTSVNCSYEISNNNSKLSVSFSNHTTELRKVEVKGIEKWCKNKIESAYIPPKDILANAPGFLPIYKEYKIHFEEEYADILYHAMHPLPRGPLDKARNNLLKILQKEIVGKVILRGQKFFLDSKQGNLEFTLLAEGLRKLGLLWILIQNGTLSKGSILFWDEPETNLNPKIMGTLINILLELQRHDTQIFIATHDYVVLKEIDLNRQKKDNIIFHALYKDIDTKEIKCQSTDELSKIHPNVILDTFSNLYNREIIRTLGGSEK
jgi:ABC-type Mn2+/Zn2+ transport system ATPase subunit